MKKLLLSFVFALVATAFVNADNYALKFSQSSDLVLLNQDDVATSWTIEAWVYKTQSLSYSTLIDGQSVKITLESWGNDGKVGITAKGVADWAFNYVAPVGEWVHLAFVCDQNTTKLYVNGVFTDEMSHVINMPYKAFGQANESARMIIDEVRFWTVVRTPEEIAEFYNKSVDPSSEGLVGYYYLDDQEEMATDISPTHLNGTISGPVYVPNDNPDFTTTLPEMSLNGISADNYNEYFVKPGSENQDILRVVVETEGVTSPIHVSSITVDVSMSDDLNDISSLAMFSTGMSPEFGTDEIFGEEQAPGSGTVTFTGDITLNPGNNYLWLACNVAQNATIGNNIDAELVNIEVAGQTETATETDYQGSRTILSGIPQVPVARDAVVPKPQEMTIDTSQRFVLTESTKIVVQNTDSTIAEGTKLSEFLKKATGYNFDVSTSASPDGNIYLKILDNYNSEIGEEGYIYNVDENGVKIEANTTAGLFYGTQTLRQLLPAEIESPSAVQGVTWDVAYASITDYPRFSWRGLHLDVSRHFFGVDFIKKYLDAMAMNKLNRFHWHLTDDQGWRIEILSKPLLQTISAWRTCNGQTYGGYYTQDQIADIVNYAAERHIMIIPEIEMPGHTVEVLAAYPELSCATNDAPHGGPFYVRCNWGTSVDIFCAGKEATFDFLEDVLTEVADMFPGPYIHLGGDEASKVRWEQCPDCQARMQELGLTDEEQLQRWFMERVGNFLATKNKKWIGWSEITYGGVPENATVMSWLGESSAILAAQQGHDAILSPYSVLYLDAPNSNEPWEPPAIGYAPNTLEKIYFYDPMPAGLTPDEQQHILGPHSCLWTEYISEEWHAEYMILPRIYALSEIGWSGNTNDFPDFRRRLYPKFKRLDLLNYTYRPLDFPKGLLPAEFSTCDDTVTLTLDIPANSFYWNDAAHTTSNSLTVTQSGTYKCYVDYLGKIYSVSSKVTIKEDFSTPQIDTTAQGWKATGNADTYLWYHGDDFVFKGDTYNHPEGANPAEYYVSGANLSNKKGDIFIAGNDDYVQLENSEFLNNAQAFTIESWVNIHQYTTWDQLFTKRVDNNHRISVELADGRFFFEIGNGSNTYGYTSTDAVKTDEWHHLAFVYNGSGANNSERMKLFIDGVEQSLSYSGGIPAYTNSNDADFTIGCPTADPGFEFTEFRLWNKALSADDINNMMDLVIEPGMDEGLEYYFRTDEGSGTVLNNSAPDNPNNGILVNSNASTWVDDYTDVMLYECRSEKWNVYGLITGVGGINLNVNPRIIPNPNNGQFRVSLELPEKENIVISVYNLLGKMVFEKEYHSAKYINDRLDLNNVKNGVYVLDIKAGKYNGRKIFVVNR